MITPRILLAGQSSGVGKTTITLGLIALLRRRGLIVQSFKCGPDYIDPTYHALASGRPCRNLDTWMLTPAQMVAEFERASLDADMAVIEGVMGLYDGSSYTEDAGSSAHIAQLLNVPVLLILDIGKMARSAGALAFGYHALAARMEPTPIQIGGVILNRAGSQNHADGCAKAIHETTGLASMGWLSKHMDLHIPERHLGLVPTDERDALEGLINKAADAIEESFDLDAIVELAGLEKPKNFLSWTEKQNGEEKQSSEEKISAFIPHVHHDICTRPHPNSDSHSPILAVARDEAFSFYYPANLELLEDAGVRIAYFSPLRDVSVPNEACGVYLGGGFPEVYVGRLSQNRAIWESIRLFHEGGKPIYAECGGFMVLTESIVDTDGETWPFCGIIPGVTLMQKRLASLGYRVAEALVDNLLLTSGSSVRGHEFHYSTWQVDSELVADSAAWRMKRRDEDAAWAPAGYVKDNLLASYLHVHFGQNLGLVQRFVEIMRDTNF